MSGIIQRDVGLLLGMMASLFFVRPMAKSLTWRIGIWVVGLRPQQMPAANVHMSIILLVFSGRVEVLFTNTGKCVGQLVDTISGFYS